MAVTTLGHGRPEIDLEIRNKLSLYAIRLDTKQFDRLDEIFTSDVVANYGFPGTVGTYHGLDALKHFLKSTLLPNYVTRHAISTIVIDFSDESTPSSTAYVTNDFFGQGNLTGQTVAIYATYRDQWTDDDGRWKLKNRTVSYIVSHSPSGASRGLRSADMYAPVAWWYHWEPCTSPTSCC